MQVRVVEFNASTPFREQLEVMARSAVFVSVHTSNLANAQFLQPGSAVVELIQRNWIWHNLDRSFQVCCSHMAPRNADWQLQSLITAPPNCTSGWYAAGARSQAHARLPISTPSGIREIPLLLRCISCAHAKDSL